MKIDKRTEIAKEQTFFDAAAEAREDTRKALLAAGKAASGPAAQISEVARGGRKLAEQIAEKNSPVAFRKYTTIDGEEFYVGKGAISDKNINRLVINWNEPMGIALAKASAKDPGIVATNRYLDTPADKNIVLDFRDENYAELRKRISKQVEQYESEGMTHDEASSLAQSQLDDILLQDLAKAREPEMQDIIRTIQAGQAEIIEKPLSSLMVVQGGPGTGKTAVALHRISYLLANFDKKLKPENVLFVGPSDAFLKYIRNIVPDASDSSLAYRTLESLSGLDFKATSFEDSKECISLKEELRMALLIEKSIWGRVRAQRTELVVGSTKLNEEILSELIQDAMSYSTYNLGRQRLRLLVEQKLVDLRVRPVPNGPAIESAVSTIWPRLTPQDALRDLFGSTDRLLAAAGEDFTAAEVLMLSRKPADRVSDQKWSHGDLALLDHANHVLGNVVKKFDYIVIDEAQDLSPMQRLSISRRSSNGQMMILGDIAQSSTVNGIDDWDELVSDLRTYANDWTESYLYQELAIAYRTPSHIIDIVSPLMSAISSKIPELRAVRMDENAFFEWETTRDDDGEIPPIELDSTINSVIEDLKSRGKYEDGRSIAIIAAERYESLDSWVEDLYEGVILVTPHQAKGREFDHVVVIDPEEIVSDSEKGYQSLFISLTRATQTVDVIHTGIWIPMPDVNQSDEADGEYVESFEEVYEIDFVDGVIQGLADSIVDAIEEVVPASRWGDLVLSVQQKLGREQG